jgi:hypothetical protein
MNRQRTEAAWQSAKSPHNGGMLKTPSLFHVVLAATDCHLGAGRIRAGSLAKL